MRVATDVTAVWLQPLSDSSVQDIFQEGIRLLFVPAKVETSETAQPWYGWRWVSLHRCTIRSTYAYRSVKVFGSTIDEYWHDRCLN